MENPDFDWKEEYKKKIVPATRALEIIQPGNRVFIGSACAAPQHLIRAFHEMPLDDVEIVHILTMGEAPYTEQELGTRFRANTFFISPNIREAVQKGRADYTPVFLSEIAELFRSGHMPIDVALVQVAPPDKYGFCSFGISVDITKPAAEYARHVIAQVNPNMPKTLGDSFIHVNDIDFLVEGDEPVLEFTTPGPSELTKRIAKNVSYIVEDGSTIQVGYGGIPSAVLSYLREKHDLGVHTEVFGDSLLELISEGIITGEKKTLHPQKIVASFCMGSRRLYDYIHNNPLFEFRPAHYVNDPTIIARNENMVAINSALEIDLTGQVCADSYGYQFYSGIGGQLDFIRGAARSKGGRPIIVLPSTRKNEMFSRIVPALSEGSGVVTSRGDVHYIVTEWGIAYLHGKSIRERALALISIAHPKFRQELIKVAKERHYIYTDQPEAPLTQARYPEEFEKWMETKDGMKVFIRPIRPADESLQRDAFYNFSRETVYYRFFSYLKAMPHEQLKKFVNIDYEEEMALVAVVLDSGMEKIVGIGRYIVDRATNFAEFALVIRDDWQGRGIGKALLNSIIEVACKKGLEGFTAYILERNKRMLGLLDKTGYPYETKMKEGIYTVRIFFEKKKWK
jgi:acyl-CoA hydrolase/GNAT superfamily N-acetyltransferase